MSYLMLPDGTPDFSKAVISLWFRVPQASIDAAAAAYKGDGSLLDGIIPLVIMGQKGLSNGTVASGTDHAVSQISYSYQGGGTNAITTVTHDDGGFCGGHGAFSYFCTVTVTYSLAEPVYGVGPLYSYEDIPVLSPGDPGQPTNPTCIGIDVGRSSEPVLYINFETNQKAKASNWIFNRTVTPGPMVTQPPNTITAGFEGTRVVTGCSIPFGLLLPFYDVVETVDINPVYYPPASSTGLPVNSYTDITDLFMTGTESINTDQISITPDVWHHVLISVDLKTIQTHGSTDVYQPPLAQWVDSAAKLYVALDDKNYTGNDLSGSWTGGDPNDVITDGARHVAGSSRHEQDNPAPPATYVLSDPMILSGGQPLGLPGTAEFVDNIYKVEMAEFVMWTGVTLDTSVETNRRMFITAPDKNGKQRPTHTTPLYIPMTKTAVGDAPTWDWDSAPDAPAFAPPPSSMDPTLFGMANKILGSPQIDFSACCINWQMGRNLGKAKSKVVKKGKIKEYFHEPVIDSSTGG